MEGKPPLHAYLHHTDVCLSHRNLSGGERQRLVLARAFMQMGRGSKILLLDEATSAVDTNTEDHMKASIKTIGAGCTCIIVA